MNLSLNTINSLIFIIGGFICVSYHNFEAAVVGLFLVLVSLIITNQFFKSSLVVIVVTTVGCLNEVLIMFSNVYEVSGGTLDKLWLVSMWLLTATTFSNSLKFYGKLPLALQALIAGTLGNLIYSYAVSLNAIELTIPMHRASIVFFVDFALLIPMLFKVNNTLSVLIGCKGSEGSCHK